MTVTAQALQQIQGKNDWRDVSSNVFQTDIDDADATMQSVP